MADPVAEKSTFLKMYMSNHPDTLVAYCKFYGKVTEPITGAEMSAIDTKSMTLTYTKKAGGKSTVVVPINPPLRGYEDVKPRLLEMKAKAQEGLGMIKAPKIPTFLFPLRALKSTIPLVTLLLYCTLSTLPSPPFPSFLTPAFYRPGALIVGSTVGVSLLRNVVWPFVVVTHTLEAIYVGRLCRTHETGFIVGGLYTLTTLLFGFPTIVDLRKRIQEARIESVMKIE